MSTAVMNSSSVSVPSFAGTKAAAKPGLSLREWFGVFSSALAMANAVPDTGRVSAKQLARVRDSGSDLKRRCCAKGACSVEVNRQPDRWRFCLGVVQDQ